MITKLFEKSLETLKQRGADNAYDKGSFENGERSGAQISRVYNAITGQNISEADAWTFLQCLKLVRMENQMRTGQGDLLDTVTDLLSYTALKSEAVLNEHRPAQVAQLVAGDVDSATLKGCAARFEGAEPLGGFPVFGVGGFIKNTPTSRVGEHGPTTERITTLNHPCVLDPKNDPTSDR